LEPPRGGLSAGPARCLERGEPVNPAVKGSIASRPIAVSTLPADGPAATTRGPPLRVKVCEEIHDCPPNGVFFGRDFSETGGKIFWFFCFVLVEGGPPRNVPPACVERPPGRRGGRGKPSSGKGKFKTELNCPEPYFYSPKNVLENTRKFLVLGCSHGLRADGRWQSLFLGEVGGGGRGPLFSPRPPFPPCPDPGPPIARPPGPNKIFFLPWVSGGARFFFFPEIPPIGFHNPPPPGPPPIFSDSPPIRGQPPPKSAPRGGTG